MNESGDKKEKKAQPKHTTDSTNCLAESIKKN